MIDRVKLQQSIDRLVEDAIRRILPGVMNEVLLQTLAGSGVLSEERPRPIRRRKLPKKRRVRVQEEVVRRPPPARRTAPPRRVDLNEVLDDSVGADAYEEYERVSVRHQPIRAPEPEPDFDDHGPASPDPPDRPEVARRLAALDPSLQAMAEGLVMPDDDGGEMWGEGEHDSIAAGPVVGSEIRDVSAAAKRAGMDFSRMRSLIERTSTPKADSEDARARAAFENQRLKRMRERLNDGKPVE